MPGLIVQSELIIPQVVTDPPKVAIPQVKCIPLVVEVKPEMTILLMVVTLREVVTENPQTKTTMC